MTGPVVVGIDDFEHSDRLIAIAADEALARGASLWLAHACPGFTPAAQGVGPSHAPEQIVLDAAEEQMTILANKVRAENPGLPVQTEVVTGPPALALAVLAHAASLLVVGGRSRGALAGQLLGAVSLRVLAHARCPVLVVRGRDERTTGAVMVAVDLAEPATGPQVLEFAFAEAARRNARLDAFYAWEDAALLHAYGAKIAMHDPRLATVEQGRTMLAAALEPIRVRYPQVSVSAEVLAGLSSKLLAGSTELADLLVIGGRPNSDGAGGMRVGAIAHTVLHHAHCPVAVVPDR
jgi:nucleotide-binding universal stress UspA family protein